MNWSEVNRPDATPTSTWLYIRAANTQKPTPVTACAKKPIITQAEPETRCPRPEVASLGPRSRRMPLRAVATAPEFSAMASATGAVDGAAGELRPVALLIVGRYVFAVNARPFLRPSGDQPCQQQHAGEPADVTRKRAFAYEPRRRKQSSKPSLEQRRRPGEHRGGHDIGAGQAGRQRGDDGTEEADEGPELAADEPTPAGCRQHPQCGRHRSKHFRLRHASARGWPRERRRSPRNARIVASVTDNRLMPSAIV
jgi:hypothetical protein